MIEIGVSLTLLYLTLFINSIPNDDFSLKGLLSHKRQMLGQVFLFIFVGIFTYKDGTFEYYINLLLASFWMLHATTSCGGISKALSEPNTLRAPEFKKNKITHNTKELLRHWIIGLVWIHKKSFQKVLNSKENTEEDNPRITLTNISNMARNIGAYIALLGIIGLAIKTMWEDGGLFIEQYYYSAFLIYILILFWLIFHRSFVNLISFEIEESMQEIEFSGKRQIDKEHKSIFWFSFIISGFISIAVISSIMTFPGIKTEKSASNQSVRLME